MKKRDYLKTMDLGYIQKYSGELGALLKRHEAEDIQLIGVVSIVAVAEMIYKKIGNRKEAEYVLRTAMRLGRRMGTKVLRQLEKQMKEKADV
jgi:hypothetical protein